MINLLVFNSLRRGGSDHLVLLPEKFYGSFLLRGYSLFHSPSVGYYILPGNGFITVDMFSLPEEKYARLKRNFMSSCCHEISVDLYETTAFLWTLCPGSNSPSDGRRLLTGDIFK